MVTENEENDPENYENDADDQGKLLRNEASIVYGFIITVEYLLYPVTNIKKKRKFEASMYMMM